MSPRRAAARAGDRPRDRVPRGPLEVAARGRARQARPHHRPRVELPPRRRRGGRRRCGRAARRR
eukprot:1472266-Prymnesium_polylepis.1